MNGQTTRYAFRSPEKVALQEIGPRFTLKLRWVKKGLPEVHNLGASPEALSITAGNVEESTTPSMERNGDETGDQDKDAVDEPPLSTRKVPPKDNEYLWRWKVSFLCSTHFISTLTVTARAGDF